MRKILLLFIAVFLLSSCPLPDSGTDTVDLIDASTNIDFRSKSSDWTIMCYMDGDNNLEGYLLADVEEMTEGLESAELINVIVLFDRIDGYSSDTSVLGADFTDTRLYRVGADEVYEIEGEEYFPDIGMGLSGEYNMGDGETLKTFIEFCKDYYPADNYGLILSNHGGGVKSISGSSSDDDSSDYKSVAYDDTSDSDALYTAELTDVLDETHYVDLLVFDACVLGMIEIAYEYRYVDDGSVTDNDDTSISEFSANFMVASAPNVWGSGFPYDRIFSRISESNSGEVGYSSTVTGSTEDLEYFTPVSLSPEDLGRIFVEEQKIDTSNSSEQVLALYDLAKAQDVLNALDEVGKDITSDSVLDDIRDETLYYDSDSQVYYPHYDLYDFADATSYNTTNMDALATEVDSMVLASFGDDSTFSGFIEGTSGLGFFFSNGDSYWGSQDWFTGEDVSSTDSWYGNLDFCHADGDGTVEGWFERFQQLYNNPYSYSCHPGEW